MILLSEVYFISLSQTKNATIRKKSNFLIFDSNEDETRVDSNATESNKGQSEKCQVNIFLNQYSFAICKLILTLQSYLI